MALPTRVYYICFGNSNISLLLLCILSLAYETTLKHIVQKRKFQQSSTFFWVGAHFLLFCVMRSLINQLYVIFGLNILLLGKSRKCFSKTMWNLPLNKTSSKWMCGKSHCQFVFLRSGKNQTCVAFIKHIPNTNVCGKSHTCLLKDKHVCHFPYKRWYFLYLQLYFVFFKRIYYIISPSVISEVTMQCQKSETSSNQPWKKSPVWEFPHMCGKNHTG